MIRVPDFSFKNDNRKYMSSFYGFFVGGFEQGGALAYIY